MTGSRRTRKSSVSLSPSAMLYIERAKNKALDLHTDAQKRAEQLEASQTSAPTTKHEMSFHADLIQITKLARKLHNEASTYGRAPPMNFVDPTARRLLTESFKGIDTLTAQKLILCQLDPRDLIAQAEIPFRQARYIEEAQF
jgi:hypothetical protein